MPSLEELLARTLELKEQYSITPNILLEEDLKILFDDLSVLITPIHLKPALDLFDDFSMLLKEKLTQIKDFIQNLLHQEQIFNFFHNELDDQKICDLFHESIIYPISLPGISTSYLQKSFNRLSNKSHTKRDPISISKELPELILTQTETIEIDFNPFENKMKSFYNTIQKKLPTTTP